MPINYFYDSQAQLLRIISSGEISVDDRIYFVRSLLEDADLPVPAPILIDVSGVLNAPTAEEVEIIGMLIKRLQSRFLGRVAIVNDTDGHIIWSHFVSFAASGEEQQVRACITEQEALDWLRSSHFGT